MSIDPSVMIALVAAVASMLVAVVSLVSSIATARLSRQSEKLIESMKYDLEKKRTDQAMSDKYFQQSIDASDELIKCIQKLKDIIQLINESRGSGMSISAAKELATNSRVELFNLYEIQLPHFSSDDKVAAHHAKNIAHSVEQYIEQSLDAQFFESDRKDKRNEKLVNYRIQLGETQETLRDSKFTRLARRLGDD